MYHELELCSRHNAQSSTSQLCSWPYLAVPGYAGASQGHSECSAYTCTFVTQGQEDICVTIFCLYLYVGQVGPALASHCMAK